MNPRVLLKLSLALVFVVVCSNRSEAATVPPTPHNDLYLVYSGTATESRFVVGSTSTADVAKTYTVYLLLDIAKIGSYSLLVTHSDGTYDIYSRILSTDGTAVTEVKNGVSQTGTDPGRNFINGVVNNSTSNTTSPTKGYAVLRFSETESSSTTVNNNPTHNYPSYNEVYATGALGGLNSFTPTTIIPANTKVKVSGVYTLPVAGAYTNVIGPDLNNAFTQAYPTSLSGLFFTYGYDSTLVPTDANDQTPDMSSLSITGKITLTLNPTLTSLANTGGSFKLKTQLNATPVNAVSGPLNASSSPTVYENFLYQIALSLGLSSDYVP